MIVFVLKSTLARYPVAGAPTAHALRSTRVLHDGPELRRGIWRAYCGLEALSWRDVPGGGASEDGDLVTVDEVTRLRDVFPRGAPPLRRCLRCDAAIRRDLAEWEALEEWRRR